MLGTYQRSHMGPNEEWAELAEWTKADRVRRGFSENEPGLRTGEMKHSYKTEVSGHALILGSNLAKAFDFEYGRGPAHGSAPQPPRPVIGTALYRKGHEMTEIVAARVAKAIR